MAALSQSSSNASIDSPPPLKRQRKTKALLKNVQDGKIDDIVDDDEELRDRRIQHIVEESGANHSKNNSPVDEKRKAVQNAASHVVSEHYSSCLKLSAENKITTKNAFNLHLIEYMSAMLHRDDSELNFQMAGTTLDASAKIYAYRVDNVHRETFKMAGGLGRTEKDDGRDEGDDNVVDNDQGTGQQTAVKGIKKRRKKVTKGNTVETSEKNLNMNVGETQFAGDALFDKVRSIFDEGGSSGLFLNTLSTAYESNRLLLHSLLDLPQRAPAEGSTEALADSSDIQEFMSKIDLDSIGSICGQLGDFSFLGWQPDAGLDQEKDNVRLKKIDDKVALTQALIGKFTVDLPPPMPQPDFGLEDEDNDDDGGDFLVDNVDARTSPEEQLPMTTMDKAISDVLSEQLEYSYFDQRIGSTLDNHRRLSTKSSVLKREHSLDEDSDGIKPKGRKTLKGKRQEGAKRKTKDVMVPYREDMDINAIVTLGTTSTIMPVPKLEQWKTVNHILDSDDKTDTLCRLFTKPDFLIGDTLTDDGTIKPVSDDALLINNPVVASTENDNGVNLSFGALSIGNDDDGDFGIGDVESDSIPNELNSQSAPPDDDAAPVPDYPFDGGLLEQPYKVNKISVSYARQAKKIDVRRVKRSMWKSLTKCDGNSSSQDHSFTNNTEVSPKKMNEPKLFSELCKELPQNVSQTTAESLSVPIVFACLLHLCNEKGLSLQDNKTGDLVISSGNNDQDDSD